MENEATLLIQRSTNPFVKPADTFQKRKEKIVNWFKDPYNLTLTAIVIFALVIRFYYFSMVGNQPLWWDEAEYLGMAKAWAFGLEYEFLPVRAILLSLVTAVFFKISFTEFLPRLFLVSLSITSIIALYYLGKETYSKRVGLIATFLMSSFYVNLFYTFRLIVDVPSLAFYTLGALFFFKYIRKNSHKSLYIGAALLAVGVMFKIPTAAFLFAFGIFMLVTERLKFLKRKELWIAGIIFILILTPYIIWGYIQFDGFVITQAGAWNSAKEDALGNFFLNIKSYTQMFKDSRLISFPLLITFLGGLGIIMFEFILGFDILLKGKNMKLKRNLFLFLIFIVPILSVSYAMGGNNYENRYILNAFPAVFIISGIFISKTYNFIKKQNKLIAIILLMAILAYSASFQLKFADNIIKSRQPSYGELKEAGFWLKANTQPNEIILSESKFQLSYYSDRESITFPQSKENMTALINSNENIKYFIVSGIQPSADWVNVYPNENNMTLIQAYFFDAEQKQPSLLIYRI